MNLEIQTQPRVAVVLDAVVGIDNGEPIVERKPVSIPLWLALSKYMPVSRKWVEEN